jgi:hypothetical protein
MLRYPRVCLAGHAQSSSQGRINDQLDSQLSSFTNNIYGLQYYQEIFEKQKEGNSNKKAGNSKDKKKNERSISRFHNNAGLEIF